MAILITGGAGYIGSIVAEDLRVADRSVVVLDSLVRGHREAVHPDIPFYEGNIGDRELVGKIVANHGVDACVHFAAFAYVGESVSEPAKYFENNFVHTLALLDALVTGGVKKIVFSSSCATYGEPQYTPIDEGHPQLPTTPYGWSKLMVERALAAYDLPYGLRSVSLRYFNAAGATPTHGEHHDPEPHLIPQILAVAAGRSPQVLIFGNDYPTSDGTAVRDYVHVKDLSQAHILALSYLNDGNPSNFINLGTGKGYSVNEVIETARRITGRTIRTETVSRRSGDPSSLTADATKARSILGWQPGYPELEKIVETAWAWHKRHPMGYA